MSAEEPVVALDFGRALRRVAIAFHRHRLGAARAAFGVGAREAATLGELYVDGPLTPTDLAPRLSVTTAAVTELADRLERAGHLSRAQHPTDRRRVLLHLTDRAEEVLGREWAGFTDVVTPVLAGMHPDACRAVTDALGDAAAALDHARALRAGGAVSP